MNIILYRTKKYDISWNAFRTSNIYIFFNNAHQICKEKKGLNVFITGERQIKGQRYQGQSIRLSVFSP
jgi:hypothetical protein